MQWSTIAATTVGAVLGVLATLVADRVRWHRERSERDRETLRIAFVEYLSALTKARDAFAQGAASPDAVGRGHVAVGEHGVYAAQLQLELVAQETLVDKAGLTTLSVLDFHDVVASGHPSDSDEYVRAWRSVRQARTSLIEEMRAALRRS